MKLSRMESRARRLATLVFAAGCATGTAVPEYTARCSPQHRKALAVQPSLRGRRAPACAAWASSHWRGVWPSHYGATYSTARSRPERCSKPATV